ncbi:DoxX family protein [Rhodoferax sp.]|uniref:DoxX family protein n=1 Tax=Rhodoferax sp. TaxID=50421 RepID=UPI002ACDB6E5|nr:DoxX family membrane protein [Rhodoferax sp.]
MNTSAPVYFPRTRSAWTFAARRLVRTCHAVLDALQAPAALLARLYVAQVFFSAGLTKLRDWDTTMLLFSEEYHVPFLSPQLAAWLGTGGELVLPALLVLGLGGRLAALGLSVVNLVAVLSLSDIAPAALQLHVTWGVLLMGLALYGPGSWALDKFLHKRWLTTV